LYLFYVLKILKKHQKQIAIAIDNGFASLSSFQRAFKRETGKTPSMWRLPQ